MTRLDRPSFEWSCRRISFALALVAGLATLLTLADPGITVDEPLDVRPGRAYLTALRTHGSRFFSRDVVTRVYADNKEHPPLGRWLLGIASTIGEPFEVMLLGGPDPLGIYVVSGRLAPAFVFALLVGCIASECGRRYGRAGAFAGGFALLVMPRVFAHAHLGALDLFIAAAWCIALIRAESALESSRPIRGLALAGVFWGLALLIKIHAWLLPPIILVRAIVRLGPKKAALAFAGWTLVGLAVFFAGWPWLWYDTVDRLRAYLGTGVERTSIYVQYFGHVYRDRDVPWHFPWFYFAATVPVGLHALGITGLIGALRARDGAALTYVGAIAGVLALFSTNVPVYDGERLFLLVFPLLAILIGRGFSTLWDLCSSWRTARSFLAAFLLAQALGLVWMHPYGLSYYNLLVGGLPGAERLGLELAYWSDSVDRPLLRRLAAEAIPGATAALAPTLAPDQGKIASSRDLIRRRLILDDEEAASRDDWLVLYRRSAYWKEPVRRFLEEGEIVEVHTRQGVWLSALVRRRKPGTPPVQPLANP
jgi:4-amino-4-deoxy-L-arabinose transferase-like glycosyltransferase